MKHFIFKIFSIVWFISAGIDTYAQQQNFLTASGNKLFDTTGKEVRLTGVNWFGFETSLYSPHGIWIRDMKSVLQQIKDLGFNTIRVPWCNEMLDPGASVKLNPYGSDPYTGVSPMNEEEATVNKPIELLDIFVRWCQENDIKIVLDNHSRAADGFLDEKFWYTPEYSEERWINDWIFMADRYKNFSAVVAMDLNNEPHGSSWGNSNPATDWNKAAERCGNAVLAVNPNVLIMVEGVGEFEGDSYWWGGQLKGAEKYPIQLSNPEKLVYSAHEYGPEVHNQDWFGASNFPQNMPGIWEEHFGYLYDNNTSPLFIGEFGIKKQDAFDGKSFTWFTELMDFMGDSYSWTFWTMNANSTDTGGILQDDWINVNQWKMDVLSSHFEPLIPNVIGGSSENSIPLANITASTISGKAPLKVEFDASKSSDADGDTLSYHWDFGNGETSSKVKPVITYSTVGLYIVTLTVNDGKVDSKSVTQTIIVKGEGSGCSFDTPSSSALSSLNVTYENIYVLGNSGPNLDNVNSFTINWNLGNNSLYQFSINTNNGMPNWYVDFSEGLTRSFNTSNPDVTLADTGIAGLDGAYWVTVDSGNFVMVSKTGEFTLYFSKTASQPSCGAAVAKVSGKTPLGASQKIEFAPNPVKDIVSLSSNVSLQDSRIRIISLRGRVVMSHFIAEDEKQKSINLQELQSGIYILEVFNAKTGNKVNQKIVKQ